MSNIRIELIDPELHDDDSDIFSIACSDSNKIFPAAHIIMDEYETISPIPYDALEDYLKDVISNWNQKQKK